VKAVRFFWRYLGCRRDLGVALIVCAIVVAAAELSIPWLLQLEVLEAGVASLKRQLAARAPSLEFQRRSS
jgi:hypothetical protein